MLRNLVKGGSKLAGNEMSTVLKSNITPPEFNPSLLKQTEDFKKRFDPGYYHGTAADEPFESFTKESGPHKDYAGFFSKDPKFAEGFSTPSGTGYESPRMMPVSIDTSEFFDVSSPAHNNKLFDYLQKNKKYPFDTEEKIDSIMSRLDDHYNNWGDLENPHIRDAIKKLGFKGTYVTEEGIKNVAPFSEHANLIRSKFAKFDPDKASSTNISDAIGGAISLPMLKKILEEKEDQ
jgi:hypothetical protein